MARPIQKLTTDHKKLLESMGKRVSLFTKGEKVDGVAGIIRQEILSGNLRTGYLLPVNVYAQKLGVSRNVISNALQSSALLGLVKGSASKSYVVLQNKDPFPEERGKIFSVRKWAQSRDIAVRTEITRLVQGNAAKLEKLDPWHQLQRHPSKDLIHVRRVRAFREPTDDAIFKKGSLEDWYLVPEICEDIASFYADSHNQSYSFQDYFAEKRGLIVVSSFYRISARRLKSEHYGAWFFGAARPGNSRAEISEISRDLKKSKSIDENGVYAKAFLLVSNVLYCEQGPLGVSYMYTDPDVVEFDASELRLRMGMRTPARANKSPIHEPNSALTHRSTARPL